MTRRNGTLPLPTRDEVAIEAAHILLREPMPHPELVADLRTKYGPRVPTRLLVNAATLVHGLPAQSLYELLETLAPPDEQETPPPRPASPFGRPELWSPPVRDWMLEDPPAQPWLLRRPTKDGQPCVPGHGDGFLRRGKAGTLTSAGGVGKSTAVLQLAIAIAAGRPWLGHFHVDRTPGRVLLALGENDIEDCHRYLHRVVASMGLAAAERQAVAERVVPMPLAGEHVALLEMRSGQPAETAHLHILHQRLAEHGPWSLIVLDTQARMAGVDVETDNSMATRFVEICESLCTAPGSPTVLVLAHSSKLARRAGTADSRGVTGLTDGFRWHAIMVEDRGKVKLVVEKHNHGPRGEAVYLSRGDGGILRVMDEAEAAAVDLDKEQAIAESRRARLDQMAERVPALLAELGGSCNSRETLARALGAQLTQGRAAVDLAVSRGLVHRIELSNRRAEYLPTISQRPNVP